MMQQLSLDFDTEPLAPMGQILPFPLARTALVQRYAAEWFNHPDEAERDVWWTGLFEEFVCSRMRDGLSRDQAELDVVDLAPAIMALVFAELDRLEARQSAEIISITGRSMTVRTPSDRPEAVGGSAPSPITQRA